MLVIILGSVLVKEYSSDRLPLDEILLISILISYLLKLLKYHQFSQKVSIFFIFSMCPIRSSFQFNQAPYDVPNMYAKPGTPCNDYNGYCDVFRKCREVRYQFLHHF